MKYIILHDTSRHDLTRKVNEYLDQGWDLHGDLIASITRIMPAGVRGEDVRISYSQAMIYPSQQQFMSDFFAEMGKADVEDNLSNGDDWYDVLSNAIREMNHPVNAIEGHTMIHCMRHPVRKKNWAVESVKQSAVELVKRIDALEDTDD